MATFTVYRVVTSSWRMQLRANNGKVICDGVNRGARCEALQIHCANRSLRASRWHCASQRESEHPCIPINSSLVQQRRIGRAPRP